MKYLFLVLVLLFLWSCEKDCCEDLINDDQVWIVKYIKVVSERTNAPHDVEFAFTPDNRYELKLDVNACGGSYIIENEEEGSWEVSPGFCTQFCCDSEFSDQVAQLINRSTKLVRKGRKLILEVGEDSVVFKPK
jgi:hypothetical protein